tara:strand:+ start:1669 stop:2079 length:411 start_codon:yes stop_codon:yes gene_type:complete
MNNTIKILSSSDFEVINNAPSMEVLESGKPKFSKNDKAAKKLFKDVQLAYDDLILAKMEAAPAFGVSTPDAIQKADVAYEHYDELVDIVVKATGGNAPAYYTDPQTVDLFEIGGTNCREMTYNEMAELEGAIAFGN